MVKALYQYTIASPHCKVRKGLILHLDDGWGEIAPLPGWSQETLEEAKKETLSVLLEGTKPSLPSVKFGFACALKAFSSAPLKVPISAFQTPDASCRCLKLKLKNIPLEQAISLVKQYAGKTKLRIDCNRCWTLEEALAFTKHFSPTDFEYLEEPVHSYQELLSFMSLTRFPVAIDESLREYPHIDLSPFKAAIVKPMLMGNIPKLDIPTVLSSSYESSLGILQIARSSSLEIAHGLNTFTDDFLTPPLKIKQGYLIWEGSQNPVDTSKLELLHTNPLCF